MNFAAAFDELLRQEFARLSDTVTPRIEAFRSMTRDGLRDELAGMMDPKTAERQAKYLLSSRDDHESDRGEDYRLLLICLIIKASTFLSRLPNT
jgi:hypothetical protein